MSEFNKKGEYAYTLLSDSKMDAAKAFGLAFKVDNEKFNEFLGKHSGESHGLLVVPAVYIVDRSSEVRFQYVNPNYKVRIDAPTVLAAARGIATN